MKHNTELFYINNSMEILVGYDHEVEPAFEAEEGNPDTLVAGMVYTELTSVEVVIAGKGIDILPYLTEKQMSKIIENLSYE